jgi:hypothetical protein
LWVEVMRSDGVVVVRCADVLDLSVCGWFRACLVVLDIWFSNRFQICWDLQDFFDSLRVFKSVEICRFLCIWLNSTVSTLTVWRWSTSRDLSA